MTQIIKRIFICLMPFLLGSCLKRDLPVMEDSKLNNISDFNLFYKYEDTVVSQPGTDKEVKNVVVRSIQLSKTLNITGDTVHIVPGFPAGFPFSQKAKVSLASIWGVANIPNAATIAPQGNAPQLGVPGDFSAPVAYDVTAANGDKKKWVISIAPLPVVNQWEGNYLQEDTLWHATAGQQVAPANYEQALLTVNATTLKATAGFWYFNNPGITYQLTVNSNNTVTISADPGAAVSVEQDTDKPSTYDPVTKKFDLHYFYLSGGVPANWRKFHTIFTLR